MGNPVAPFKNVLVIVARDDENFITTLTIFMYINWIVIMHHLVITYVIWRALLQFFFKFYKKKSLNESLSDKVKYVKRSQKATLKNSRETNSYFSIHPSIYPSNSGLQECRREVGYTLDCVCDRANTERQTAIHTYINTESQFRNTN